MIIAVDFDGTLCKMGYPDIGEPRYGVIQKVLRYQREGAKLILWTCRSGQPLAEAVEWCKDHGIVFDAINENIKGTVEAFLRNNPGATESRKVFADIYLDDMSTHPDLWDKSIKMPQRGSW